MKKSCFSEKLTIWILKYVKLTNQTLRYDRWLLRVLLIRLGRAADLKTPAISG